MTGVYTTYKNCDDWGMVTIIVLLALNILAFIGYITQISHGPNGHSPPREIKHGWEIQHFR